MSLIKKIFLNVIILILCFSASAEEIKKIGKFKDWETMVLVDDSGVMCFAQSKPILQAPKKNKKYKISNYGHGFGCSFWILLISVIFSSLKFTFTLSIFIFNCSIVVAPIITLVING